MIHKVKMPQLGLTETSAILSRWHVKVGDKVNVGQYLFSLETGKATFEVEAEFEGIVLDIFYAEDEEVEVKKVVCILGEEGDTYIAQSEEPAVGVLESVKDSSVAANTGIFDIDESDSKIGVSAYDNKDDKLLASPRARATAKRLSVELTNVKPTGPEGRIIEADVIRAKEEGMQTVQKEQKLQIKLAGEDESSEMTQSTNTKTGIREIPHSNIRKVIARNMHRSLSEMAQFTMNTSFDASEILAMREKFKRKGADLPLGSITINDMILFVLSRTLPEFPELNAHYDDEKLTVFENVHLGVAVNTQKGLMVPTIFNSNLMSLLDISKKVKELAACCKNGTISSDLLRGGSFTTSNLGSWGIESFTPVINPPQTAILGICGISDKIIKKNNQIDTYPAMTLSLTIDHRAIDGARGAEFLKRLRDNLEAFSLIMTI